MIRALSSVLRSGFLGRLLLVVLFADPVRPASAAAESAPPASPNVILILADDLGYGDLGCYGQEKIQTPHLDRLAREGVRFTQFYTAAPVCAPARDSLLTGRHAGHAQFRGNAKLELEAGAPTLGEMLRPSGYRTGLVGKWGLGKADGPAAPWHRGFDYFFGYVDQTMAHNYYPTYLYRNAERVPLRNVVPHPGPYDQGVASVKLDYSADLLAAEAVRFIEDNRARPFFLYFAPTLPHANGEATPDGMEVPDYGPYEKEPWPAPAKGYAAMVSRLDAQVGRLLATLETLAIDRNTLVIFTSDNGPHSEGGYDPATFRSSGGLRGEKRDLYEGGIREPMLVRWPGKIPGGRVVSEVGYAPDVMATISEFTGATAPRNDGISLAPLLLGRGEHQAKHEFLYWEFYEKGTGQAVRFGDWKAIRFPVHTGEIQLYHLTEDPTETRDVATAHPDLVARARDFMQRAHTPSAFWEESARRQLGKPAPEPK